MRSSTAGSSTTSAALSCPPQMVGGARPDDRRGDRGVRGDERQRQLDQRQARLVGEGGEFGGGVELGLVARYAQVVVGGGGTEGHRPRTATGEAGRVTAPAAGQPASGERTPGEHPHP